jgi:hypothetical protein
MNDCPDPMLLCVPKDKTFPINAPALGHIDMRDIDMAMQDRCPNLSKSL